MANYNIGSQASTRNGQRIQSIIDIDNLNNNTSIIIFPGTLGPNDIRITYKQGTLRRRTPKHIHWAVDLLLKRENNLALTNDYSTAMQNRWNGIQPLPNRQFNTIRANLQLSTNQHFINQYAALNAFGSFEIDFLTHFMELLMLEEITNFPNAYMYIGVIEAILTNADVYTVVSKATHGG